MDLRIEDLTLFVELVDTRSFSEAARRLELPRPTVSRRLAALEQRLGVRLLWRTTRQVRPTDVGVNFYDKCQTVLASLGDAERLIAEATAAPSGHLRIVVPPVLGPIILGDTVERFMMRHRQVTVELRYDDRPIDPRAAGFDLAIRGGPFDDESLVVRRVGELPQRLCASPDHLADGAPRRPADLESRDLLLFAVEGEVAPLWLHKGRRSIDVRPRPVLRANDHKLLRSAAAAGRGIALLPAPMCEAALGDGTLVPVLPSWTPEPLPINVAYVGGALMSPTLNALLELLSDSLDGVELPCHARPPRRRRAAMNRS